MGMKYRVAVSALIIALGGFAVAGCSEAGQAGGQDSNVKESQAQEKEQASTGVFNLEGVIEQSTILDNDIMSVDAVDLSYKNNVAYLKVSVTNKTESEISATTGTIGFSGNYVNDQMIEDGWMSCDVAPGESAEGEIRFDLSNLQIQGITGIGEIGLGIRVTDSNYDQVYKGIVSVATNLQGKVNDRSFSEALSDPAIQKLGQFEVKNASSKFENIDWGGLVPLSASLVTNKDGEHSVMMEVKNNTDKIVSAVSSNITVDGTVAYEGNWSSTTVAPGKSAVIYVNLENAIDDEQVENFNLNEVKSVSMDISVKDFDGNDLTMPASVDVAF